MAAPQLPNKSWANMQAVPDQHQAKTITADLDAFIRNNAGLGRVDLILHYVRNLGDDINNSQLLAAELVYLFFADAECPINYNASSDYWHVWDGRWHTTGQTISHVKLYFQTDLLQAMRQVL